MPQANLANQIADQLRNALIQGHYAPGQRLSEPALCEQMGISRNTLREAFRLLTRDGLLTHSPNRGVFVMVPSAEAIIDLYRIRRMVECQALRQAYALHPGKKQLRHVMAQAVAAHEVRDWHAVGKANMAFHQAIADLGDSERTSAWFAQLLAELHMILGLLRDPELVHAQSVARNQRILELVLANQFTQAAQALREDLTRVERVVLALHARQRAA